MNEAERPWVRLVDVVPRIGALAWVAEQLFTIQGTWAETMQSPAAAVHLASASRHHGSHVGLWRDALPDSPALDGASHVGPPSSEWSDGVTAAHALAAESDPARLTALYRGLVPRHLSLLEELAERLGGPGDAHIQRVLSIVGVDAVADLKGGHRLLETALGDNAAIDSATSAVKALDQAFRT